MADYRLYLVDAEDRFTGVEIAECPTDGAAVARAHSIAGPHQAVEVWELGRRVGRAEAEGT